jgi:predicted benzoate:H+ symporter BenE
MSSTTVFIIAGGILLAIFFLVARLAIRWAVRIMIVGVILVALTGVAGFWWWTNRLAPAPAGRPRPTPTTHPASTKRSPNR